MPIQFQGETYPMVAQDKMTPGEIDAVERATGLTFQKIRRMGETCVCDHGVRDHTHLDDQGEQTDDTSCKVCTDCDQHQPDLPSRISTAFVWVSIKRVNPAVKFSDVSDAPMTELFQPDAEEPAAEPDPTDAPPAEASLT